MNTHTNPECHLNLSILYVPDALRSAEEHRALLEHMSVCGPCRARSQRLAEAIEGFCSAPDPPVPPAMEAAILARIAGDRAPCQQTPPSVHGEVRARDAGKTVPRTVVEKGVHRVKAWFQHWHVPLAVLAPACAAVALLVFGLPRDSEAPGIREKSPGAASIRPSIDLQATVETLGPDGRTTLSRVEDGMVIGPRDGLLFQFAVEGISQISLVECDPTHTFHILFDQAVEASTTAQLVPLADPTGRLLRYTPDGPPGEYVYLAVASPEPFTWNAPLLDSVWNHYIDRLLEPLRSTGQPAVTLNGAATLTIDAIRVQFQVTPEAGDRTSASATP